MIDYYKKRAVLKYKRVPQTTIFDLHMYITGLDKGLLGPDWTSLFQQKGNRARQS